MDIVDEGEGIAEEILPKVFNPFYTTKTEGSGTGLGLSVSYGIVKKHNGQISLENVEAGGIKASVVLPRQPLSPTNAEAANTELEVRHVG